MIELVLIKVIRPLGSLHKYMIHQY